MRRGPRHRLGRTRCPRCDRDIAAYVPRHGDGTAYRVVWHLDPADRTPCDGRFDIVDTSDLTLEPFDGR